MYTDILKEMDYLLMFYRGYKMTSTLRAGALGNQYEDYEHSIEPYWINQDAENLYQTLAEMYVEILRMEQLVFQIIEI